MKTDRELLEQALESLEANTFEQNHRLQELMLARIAFPDFRKACNKDSAAEKAR